MKPAIHRFRLSGVTALVVGLFALTGCSGSSTGNPVAFGVCDGGKTNALCLVACNLGCSSTRCEISDIAQNQHVTLRFSQPVDGAFANTNTIQFRTATGEAPVGEFLTHDDIVEFVPQVVVVGGQSFYGFRAGETYTMTLPGGKSEINAVRSTAGNPLKATYTCTLNVTRGIEDLNGVPPAATLVSPTQIRDVPADVTIQLEFNEIIDATPFQGTGAGDGPVTFKLRRTRDTGGALECNPNSLPVAMVGAPRLDTDIGRGISVLTFRPSQPLPTRICVEIEVTDRVRDLSGKPALSQVFQFLTVNAIGVEHSKVEDFATDGQLDRDSSSGSWSGNQAIFGQIGGDARHGTFDPTIGVDLGVISGKHTYSFDTTQLTIPGTNTFSGDPITVTDGRFYFDKMILASDVRLRFTGSNPPQFNVAGRIEINGIIEMSGESTVLFNVPSTGTAAGQPGGRGGIFAGSGGKGGDRCMGTGASPAFNGDNGQDCRVLAGHAYAGSTVGTGGRGSPLFPAAGLTTALIFPGIQFFEYCSMTSSGGGGGGYSVAGGTGAVVFNANTSPLVSGAPSPGGSQFPLFPIPGTTTSSLHFLVGGSGGGGGGSHPAYTNSVTRLFSNGAGGGGGGGAIALRAGDTLRVASSAQILAAGGSSWSQTGTPPLVTACPAGGGSGGSVLLQAGRLPDVAGLVDVRGGARGVCNRAIGTPPPTGTGASMRVEGGDGAPGFVRLESPLGQNAALLAGAQPPAAANNTDLLTETDSVVAFRSLFYSTDSAFGPEYVRYEIRAHVNNVPVVYSDDASVGVPARFGSAPIQAWFQASTVDVGTGAPVPGTAGRWHQNVGSFGGQPAMADDALNGFRYTLLLDRSLGQTVVVDSVTVVYRL